MITMIINSRTFSTRKSVTTSITYVSSTASNANIRLLGQTLNALTTNVLQSVYKQTNEEVV